MHAAQWADILKRVRLEEQNALLLGLSNGSQISVQDLLRIDEEYVLLRGRIGGTTDAGRVFCLPYQQLTYCCLTRTLPEESIIRIFGELQHTMEDDGPLREIEAAEEPAPAPAEEPKAEEPPQPARIEPAAPSPIRDRLRKRLASTGEKRGG
jgi:hypothetical protein